MSIEITEWIIRIPVLLFAITIHEYSHGKAAFSLGDPTAKNAGRLSFNPLTHIDPLGALCLFLFNFGWAKPVPVNVNYFRNRRRDIILMALSGPVSNIATAFAAGLFIRYFYVQWEIYQKLLFYMILMNCGLGIFNLLPIPPLDRSHVMENILPYKISLTYRKIGTYAPFLLVGILIFDNFARINILGKLLGYPIFAIAHLFGGDNFYSLIFQAMR
ncbi:MAG: site-2 protease family protein [Deltaproteobacteria bacterium]|nr:site-2 protease family protein [Deltaproteobacteria bacterium]